LGHESGQGAPGDHDIAFELQTIFWTEGERLNDPSSYGPDTMQKRSTWNELNGMTDGLENKAARNGGLRVRLYDPRSAFSLFSALLLPFSLGHRYPFLTGFAANANFEKYSRTFTNGLLGGGGRDREGERRFLRLLSVLSPSDAHIMLMR